MNKDTKNMVVGVPVTGVIVGLCVAGNAYPTVGRYLFGLAVALVGLFFFGVLSYAVGNAITLISETFSKPRIDQ